MNTDVFNASSEGSSKLTTAADVLAGSAEIFYLLPPPQTRTHPASASNGRRHGDFTPQELRRVTRRIAEHKAEQQGISRCAGGSEVSVADYVTICREHRDLRALLKDLGESREENEAFGLLVRIHELFECHMAGEAAVFRKGGASYPSSAVDMNERHHIEVDRLLSKLGAIRLSGGVFKMMVLRIRGFMTEHMIDEDYYLRSRMSAKS